MIILLYVSVFLRAQIYKHCTSILDLKLMFFLEKETSNFNQHFSNKSNSLIFVPIVLSEVGSSSWKKKKKERKI